MSKASKTLKVSKWTSETFLSFFLLEFSKQWQALVAENHNLKEFYSFIKYAKKLSQVEVLTV